MRGYWSKFESILWTSAFGGAAIVLAALSFDAWFRYDVLGTSAAKGPFVLPHSVDAWKGSSLWTGAVLLSLIAGALGMVASLSRRRGRSVTACVVGLASASVAVGLVLRQRWLLDNPSPPGPIVSKVVIGPSKIPDDPYFIRRDHLADYVRYNGLGQHAGQTGIPLVALALTALVGGGLLAVWVIRLRQSGPRGATGDVG